MKTIMKRAHEIRKEAAAKWNCKNSEIVFSICLKMAWEEGKMNYEKFRENYTKTIEIGLNTEAEIKALYEEHVKAELEEANKKNTAKNEKIQFLADAVEILGESKIIECFEETGKTRASALKAIAGECGFNKLTRDEIEYQLSIA